MNVQIVRSTANSTPPGFVERFDEWSFEDGAPEGCACAKVASARLVDDPDFGACLEFRTAATVQRLRWMAEVSIRAGHFVEVSTRLKVMRGPQARVRISACRGSRPGQRPADRADIGPAVAMTAHDIAVEASAIIGPAARGGVHMVWDRSVPHAHVGVDVLGAAGTTLRVGRLAVREVTRRFLPLGPVLPGFQDF